MINLKVIDISHHNMVTGSFSDVRASGVVGVIHKASQGINFSDAKYTARRQAALDAGLLWGAYHFADASDVNRQAKFFLSTTEPDEDTLVALDFEPNGSNTMGIDGAREFLQVIEQELGRKAVLYSGNLIKEQLGDASDAYLGSHRLWLAHYSNTPKWPAAWTKCWLHQFSDGAVNSNGFKVPGLAGQVDLNSYSGSDDDLAVEWSA